MSQNSKKVEKRQRKVIMYTVQEQNQTVTSDKIRLGLKFKLFTFTQVGQDN